jgi:hypothetical protein
MPHDGNDHSAISHNSDDTVLFRFLVSSSAGDGDCDCHQRTLCCGNRVSYRSNRLVGELKLARSCMLLKTERRWRHESYESVSGSYSTGRSLFPGMSRKWSCRKRSSKHPGLPGWGYARLDHGENVGELMIPTNANVVSLRRRCVESTEAELCQYSRYAAWREEVCGS